MGKGCCCVAMTVVDSLSTDIQGPVSHRQKLVSRWHSGAGNLQVEVWKSSDGSRSAVTLIRVRVVTSMSTCSADTTGFQCLFIYRKTLTVVQQILQHNNFFKIPLIHHKPSSKSRCSVARDSFNF